MTATRQHTFSFRRCVDAKGLLQRLRLVSVDVIESPVEIGGYHSVTRLYPLGFSTGKDAKGRGLIVVGTHERAMRSFSDAFQWRVRSECSRRHSGNSLKKYMTTKKRETISLLRKEHRPVSPCNFIMAANMSARHVCDNFDVTIALAVYKLFHAARVLDICAGWGDRLIAAIACGISYTGIDINEELFKGYDEIISSLTSGSEAHKYRMIHAPAESVVDSGRSYNVIFTSPPYFSSEVYSHDERNTNRFNDDLSAWTCKFLLQALVNAWQCLEDGGFLIIALNDSGKTAYTESVSLLIDICLPHSLYRGCLGFKYPQHKDTHPMWVWQKSSNNTQETRLRKEQCQKALQRHYPHLQSCVQ